MCMGGAWGCRLGLWVHQCERVSIGRGRLPNTQLLEGSREWCLSGEGAPGCEGPGSWLQPIPVISMVSFRPSQWAGNGPRGHPHHQMPLPHLPLRQSWELLSRLLPTQTWGGLSSTVDCAWPTPISSPDHVSVALERVCRYRCREPTSLLLLALLLPQGSGERDGTQHHYGDSSGTDPDRQID